MSTKYGNEKDESSHPDASMEKKIKFLCSFGGKIIPKPSDGQLVYVGGDTRVIAIPRSITFAELKREIEDTYKTPRLVIKYRIMPEDLDTLVSVMSDDDMTHMWDECDKLASQNVSANCNPKLFRLFIFQKSLKSPPQISIQNYFDANNRKPSKLDTSSTYQVANGPFHKVMSTPNLSCGNRCGGGHPNQSQGFCGMEAPVARRRRYHNLGMDTGGGSRGPGMKSRILDRSKMVLNFGSNNLNGGFGTVYGKFGHEAVPSCLTPGTQQSRVCMHAGRQA